MEFTDNVFREPGKDKEDVLWKFTPGLSATYLNDLGKIGVSYEADFKYFTKYGDPNNDQDQSFGAVADLYPIENMYVHVTEQLTQKGSRGGAIDLEPVNYLDNTVSVTTGYKMGRWTPEVGYRNFIRDFKQSFNGYDYGENVLTVRLYQDIVKDIRTNITSHFGSINYDNDPTKKATYYELRTGIEGTLMFNVYARADVGFHHRKRFNNNRQNFNAVVSTISLRRNFGAKTTVEAGFVRRPVETAFANETFYDDKFFYVSAKHKITPKLRGRVTYRLGRKDYQGYTTLGTARADRSDDSYSVNVGADYAARSWMILHLDYNWERRESNFSTFDYTENRVSLGVTMPF